MQRFDHPADAARWLRGLVRGELHADSRAVGPGDGFIAWPGAATDGRHHVSDALARGAAACLVEADGVESFAFTSPLVAACQGLKAAAGPVAAQFYGAPGERLRLIAVTGTNGKTSSAWWLAQALAGLGGCGLVGTLGIGVPPQVESSGLTTPDPCGLQRALRRFADDGLGACAMEASSIGLAEHRLDGTPVEVAVFTNFTQDHLDYHGTMEAYWAAKRALFDWPTLRAGVVNLDDPRGAALAQHVAARGLDLWTTSCGSDQARLQACRIRDTEAGMAFTVREGEAAADLEVALIGRYNVANLLGVIGAMRALGIPLAEAASACTALTPVPGRMEHVRVDGAPLVAVDYAHTPDALDHALQALRPLTLARGGQLWCVFGCGGDRDATKRPMMAAVAQRRADRVVVTSDNPRSERPEAIIAQVLRGFSDTTGVDVEVDRADAIAFAVDSARPTDVILLAGKGHERHQEIAGRRLPFHDAEQARAALLRRGAGAAP